ncbi:unnamed protein product [Closterium sp. NIES-53]
MWDPKSKRTLVSRDVKFVEDVMYKDWQQQQQVQIGLRLQEIERSAVEEVQLHLEDLPGSELTSDHSGGGEQQVSGPAAEEGLEDESARVDSPSQPELAATAKVTKRMSRWGSVWQKLLMDNFKCKMLGDVHYYLGLQIERDVERRWLKVHQSHYISGIMERYGVTGGRTVMTPFPAGFKLKKAAEEDDVLEDEQRNEYQSLIGSVMYAAVHTRPDASFGVGQLARVVQRPTEEQLEVAKRLVRYLGSTASAGVQFSAGGQLKQIGADGVTPGTLKLSCFTDATWASEDEDQSSVGGFVCMVGGGPYMAMYHAIKEIVLLRKLLEDMGAEQEGPTPLFSDSEAAIGMANNPILNGLNKHMKIKWHWVRQMVKEGIVELRHVKASKQAADFLTKRLPESAHWKCAKMCGMALH